MRESPERQALDVARAHEVEAALDRVDELLRALPTLKKRLEAGEPNAGPEAKQVLDIAADLLKHSSKADALHLAAAYLEGKPLLSGRIRPRD